MVLVKTYRHPQVPLLAQGVKFRERDLEERSVGCVVQGTGCAVAGLGPGVLRERGISRDSGLWFQVSGSEFRVSGFGFRVSGFGFRISGFGLQVSDFRFRVSGFRF